MTEVLVHQVGSRGRESPFLCLPVDDPAVTENRMADDDCTDHRRLPVKEQGDDVARRCCDRHSNKEAERETSQDPPHRAFTTEEASVDRGGPNAADPPPTTAAHSNPEPSKADILNNAALEIPSLCVVQPPSCGAGLVASGDVRGIQSGTPPAHLQPGKLQPNNTFKAGRRRSSLTMHIHSPTGLCMHPLSRTKEPYEIDLKHSLVDSASMDNLQVDRRRRRRSTPLLSAMDPTNGKIIRPLASFTLKRRSISGPAATTGASPALTSRRRERFNYAKALLLSDDELERFSRKIRLEINESELYELALAAEKAAAAGDSKFSGRLTTFGQTTDTTMGASEILRNSSTTSRKTTRSRPGNRDAEAISLPDAYTSNDPNVGSANLSLLEKPKTSPLTQRTFTLLEPEKRSMEVSSLRNVNEVIPRWLELHGHMRTHLFMEKVDQSILSFSLDHSDHAMEGSTCHRFPSLSVRDSVGPRRVALSSQNIFLNPHRRSRSWLDDIADIALPALGGTKSTRQLEEARDSPTATTAFVGSFDDNATDHFGHKRKEKGLDESIQSLQPSSPSTLTDRASSMEGNSLRMPVPLSLTNSSYEDQKKAMRPELPTSLVARLLERPEAYDTHEHSSVERLHDGKAVLCNHSASSSETSSVVAANNIAHSDLKKSDSIAVKTVPSRSKNPLKADVRQEDDLASSVALFDIDDESTCEPSLEASMHSMNHSPSPVPQTPNVNEVITPPIESVFSTPAHLRVIKELHRDLSVKKAKAHNANSKQERQQQRQHADGEICTPAISFDPFEPNSIVATSPSMIGNIARRTTAPLLYDAETAYLALPTIQWPASVGDTNLDNGRQELRAKLMNQRQKNVWSPIQPDLMRSFLRAGFNEESPQTFIVEPGIEAPTKEHPVAHKWRHSRTRSNEERASDCVQSVRPQSWAASSGMGETSIKRMSTEMDIINRRWTLRSMRRKIAMTHLLGCHADEAKHRCVRKSQWHRLEQSP